MDSLRTTALQRELTRIENEAREMSIAAMNAADTLEAAEQLCVLINAGLDLDFGVKPSVIYRTDGADVVVFTHWNGAKIMQRAEEVELEWSTSGDFGVENDKRIAFSGFDGVSLIIEHTALAHYLAGRVIEKAAA